MEKCPNCGYCSHCGRYNEKINVPWTTPFSTPYTITCTDTQPNFIPMTPTQTTYNAKTYNL